MKTGNRNSPRHREIVEELRIPHKTSTSKFFEKHAECISVFQLPSHTPDCNPIEMLWKKIKQKDIHLHYFPTSESPVRKVGEALIRFGDTSHEILADLKNHGRGELCG